MVPAGNKAKCLSSVNDTTITIHHHHHHTEWIFFSTSHYKSPCYGVGGFVKCHVTKSSLQRPLHDQILSYQSTLDLCVREILSITFFWYKPGGNGQCLSKTHPAEVPPFHQ